MPHGTHVLSISRSRSMCSPAIPRERRRRSLKALADIEPILRYDFANLLHAVGHEKSITIRLLDPPVHEFLPKDTELDDPEILEEITKYCGVSETTLRAKIAKLRETNPMLGNEDVGWESHIRELRP